MSLSIDARVADVLEQYHRRLEDERPRMRRAMEEGTFGQRIDEFLLPVGPESGRLVNVLAKSLKAPTILELGTSFGYSGIWLAEAARATGGRLVTMDLSAEKSAYAHEMSCPTGSISCSSISGRASISRASRRSTRSSIPGRSSSATT